MGTCSYILIWSFVEIELASAIENASLLRQYFTLVYHYLICTVALFVCTNAYFTTWQLEEIQSTKRIGATCSAWEALARNHHLLVGSVDFDMRASAWSITWSLIKIILAKSSCITLSFVVRLAFHNFGLITAHRFDVGACVWSCGWVLLKINLTEVVIEAKSLAWHSFTDQYFLFISYIGFLVSAGPWSRTWLFNEIHGTVLSKCSLCADCCRSVFAVGNLGLVMTELSHVSADSCNFAGLFFIVHHALAIIGTSGWRTGFACCNYVRITLIL